MTAQMGPGGKLYVEEMFSMNEARFGAITEEQLIEKIKTRLKPRLIGGGGHEPFEHEVYEGGNLGHILRLREA